MLLGAKRHLFACDAIRPLAKAKQEDQIKQMFIPTRQNLLKIIFMATSLKLPGGFHFGE